MKIFLKSELVSWFWKYMVRKSRRGWGDPCVYGFLYYLNWLGEEFFLGMYLGEIWNTKGYGVWKKVDFICVFASVCIYFSFNIEDCSLFGFLFCIYFWMIFLIMEKVVHWDEGILSLLRHFATRVMWLI